MHSPVLTRFLRPLLTAGLLAMAAPARAEMSWIWTPKADATPVSLRKEFNLAVEAREAVLQVAADNGAKVLVNGELVLTNEDWNSPSRANVTARLKPGRNEIRAEAKNDGGQAGFVARLRIKAAGGTEIVFETDDTWQAKLPGDGTWQKASVVGKYGGEPWGDVFGTGEGKPLVVQPGELQLRPGFRAELLYVVPKAEEGSWVSMTVDPKGRIVACDQYGGLYRMVPSPVGSGAPGKVEKLNSDVGGAHGLLYAFDSLYVMVNEQSGRQGLWRLRDTDGDDQFDKQEQLRRIQGGGEHGPHAVVLSPDKKSIYLVIGNHTKLPDGMEYSRPARNWQEDHIVGRLWDANGHARGILAPGGYICRTDPDGKAFELVSFGYRNSYDTAFTPEGDPITYDSDMEWDAGMPWYRPTRICLASSGSDLGWRSGSGKWPPYYPDSLPALYDVGPGSPTGVESGAGARFPAAYQHAIFANDWTYGTMYAVHLEPQGGGYKATTEEFVSGRPLPLTDLVVNPHDGALYFAIGGRKTQSAVYRVTYTGKESTEPAPPRPLTEDHKLRRELEAYHDVDASSPQGVLKAWQHLDHPDRWIRYAARVAIERQPAQFWAEHVLSEKRPWAIIETTIAAAHAGLTGHRDRLLERLNKVDFAALPEDARLATIRAYQLVLLRLGMPEGATRAATLARLDALLPARHPDIDLELAQTLIALDSPTAVAKTLQLLSTARAEDVRFASEALLSRNSGYATAFNKAASSRPNQQQIAYAFALRVAKAGWSPALRRSYFGWFPGTAPWEGGNSFRGFLENIRKEALGNVPDEAERKALDELSSRKNAGLAATEFAPPKGPGQDYTVDSLVGLAGGGLKGRNFEDGRRLFHAAACNTCHPFKGSGGGVGPDLTGAGSRYTLRDLVENIVEPSKVISDQYGSEQVELSDGSTLIGRAYEEAGRIHVVFDPRNPEEKESAELSKVKSRKPYPVSLMPSGLLNSMNPEEVLNLLAYIQAAGDPKAPAFSK